MEKLTKTKSLSQTQEQKLHGYIKEENKKAVFPSFQSLAKFTALAGVIALIFEVRYFSQHSTLIYFSRLSSILLAYLLLLTSNTKFGKKHPFILIHILLFAIVMSFGVMIYLEPKTLVFNSHIISLILFTAALFLSWEVTNQILVAIYYNLVFAASIIFSDRNVYILPNIFESVVLVLTISLMAIVASYINFKLKRETIIKSYEVSLSEKKHRSIFENSIEGIFQITPKGKFLTISPSLIKMLGYTHEEEVKKLNFIDDLFKRKGDWELLNRLLGKQGKVKNYRVPFAKKDGTEIAVRINIRLDSENDGDVVHFEGSIQDITQQVQAENERQKATDALRQEKLKSDMAGKKALQESNYKSKFLANMSHEVRTPMNSVMGFLTLIENDLFESPEELKSFSRDARLASESLLEIINNILDISKIEAGKMELDNTEFDLREEIHKATSILAQTAKQKGLGIEQKIDNAVPKVLFGDSTRYRQIVLNLLSNAIKFTDEGRVAVNVKVNAKTDHSIELMTMVEDTGQGIPGEKIPMLFEPYAQVRSKKGKKEGTGLGLVISKEFVRLMGGEIKVESKIGVGSKFFFTAKINLQSKADEILKGEKAPVVIEESDKLQVWAVKGAKSEQAVKKKILLVEDNPISQNLEMKILREVGYNVDAVSSGYDAIESIKTGTFDLVLMDVEMTDMDGITVTKKVRDFPGRIGKTPIIAVTAHSSMKDREKCLAAGMDDYIAKPINIHFLKLTIDQWLNVSK